MKILVPIDFYKTSLTAFYYAARLAELLGAQITLIHVVNSSLNSSEAILYNPYLSLIEAAERKLKVFQKEIPAENGIEIPSLLINREVIYGIPSSTILDHAEENDFDLIVMGTRDKHGIFSAIMGSVSAIVTRKSKCPVILIHEATRFNPPHKIAFGFDQESDLTRTLEQYKLINKKLKAKTDFVYVQTDEDANIIAQKNDIVRNLFENDEAEFSFDVKSIQGKDIESALKDYCLFEKVDMLALMHRKEGLFGTLFQSSKSVKLAQDFHLPVIVFHEN